MWKADKLGYRGNTGYNKAYQGDELVWEKPGPIVPPDGEIWYTTTDGNKVAINNTEGWPRIVSNTYINGKGVIKFASDIDKIVVRAFFGTVAHNLATIEFPNSIKTIESAAFFGLDALTYINIGNSVMDIGTYVFAGCDGFVSITLPASLTRIRGFAFNNCSKLTNISYTGTKAQWNQIRFGTSWIDDDTPATVVHCTDGDVPI